MAYVLFNNQRYSLSYTIVAGIPISSLYRPKPEHRAQEMQSKLAAHTPVVYDLLQSSITSTPVVDSSVLQDILLD